MAVRAVAALSLAVSFSAVTSTPPFGRGFNPQTCSSYTAHCSHSTCASCPSSMPAPDTHIKARTSPYPGSKVTRSTVPDDKVCWPVVWPDYHPVEFTAPPVLAGPVWADPEIGTSGFTPKFNQMDGKVQRQSLAGTYDVVDGRPRFLLPQHSPHCLGAVHRVIMKTHCPLEEQVTCLQERMKDPGSMTHRNPVGRTGLIGRGLLGRWGPNHAADPIITRWKRNANREKEKHASTGKNILEFVAIQRKDCGEWAIPGGMVDPGEKIGATLKREFGEEALNALQKSSTERKVLEEQLDLLFSQENFEVYKGYVDDPRNTDNAWMETEAVNYHDDTGAVMDSIPLEAGDDAGKVKWVPMGKECQLYANHAHFIQLVAAKRNAHW